MVEDLPAQVARTKRFTAGVPQSFEVVADGRYVTYLRDGAVWAYEPARKQERRVGTATSYTTNGRTTLALLHDSKLSVVRLHDERAADSADERPPAVDDVDDARVDPTGRFVAFAKNRRLGIVGLDGGGERVLVEPDGDDVIWGRAEFAARMSMGRDRGFWWSPDGERLLVARVDESRVALRHLFDPTEPTRAPRPFRYPVAGTANADVSLHLVDLTGDRLEVRWDHEQFEYLVQVAWTAGKPLIVVQTRDQRLVHLLEVDPATGTTTLVREVTDPAWVDVPPGVPSRTAAGDLVWIERDGDTTRLLIGDEFVTPPGLQVAEVRSVAGDVVTFLAQTEPTEVHVYTYDGAVRRLTDEAGVHSGLVVDGTSVLDCRTLDGHTVTVNGHSLASYEEEPVLDLRVNLVRAGERELRTAVHYPSWHEPGTRLPVLLTPYAGPGLQVVVAYRSWFHLVAQWFAEQGFIVLRTDGRGTPGRGPVFEREILGDTVTPVLDDQIDALHAVAERDDDLDLSRVAMRGWSFSGFLSAAAVLHRPETFHAGIAGAAVSDQRGYDTYWKERFLGHPDENPEAYRRSSLLPYAAQLSRPLLIIQGMLDTNVWATHALQLSRALVAAGRPHTFLPLPAEGHRIADQTTVANLLHLELAFLRDALGEPAAGAS